MRSCSASHLAVFSHSIPKSSASTAAAVVGGAKPTMLWVPWVVSHAVRSLVDLAGYFSNLGVSLEWLVREFFSVEDGAS
jgi:hypothetical protein